MGVLEQIKEIDAKYHFFNHIAESISEDAPFYISVKDCLCVKDMPTTAGSCILDGYRPRFDATCVKRLKEAGGVVLGKTAQDAFGFGSFNTNVGLGKKVPLNPFDVHRATGGSSGGAAGIAQRFKHIALGQSTGGSIVCPASFCGVVGLCPTYGRVSRHGLIDYANSLDKIGPITQTVEEAARALEIISGPDGFDGTCVDKPRHFLAALGKDIKDLRIGVIEHGFAGDAVAEKVRTAIASFGLPAVPVELPLTKKYSIPTYYLIAMSEASTNLARYAGLRYGQEEDPEGVSHAEYFTCVRSKHFNEETKRRVILGTFARMAGFRDAYYLQAMKVRTLIIQEYKKLFEQFDVLISPTMPIVAPTFDEIKKLTPMQHYMMDELTAGPNLTGLPHMSVPCGKVNGLPVGMLLIADHFREDVLLQLGYHYENNNRT